MLSHRERAQQLMADPLFEVANHTWEHRNLRTVSGQAVVDEIRNAQLAYKRCVRSCKRGSAWDPIAAHARASRRRGGLGSCVFLTAPAAPQRWTRPRTRD